jgi:hypothetical protein
LDKHSADAHDDNEMSGRNGPFVETTFTTNAEIFVCVPVGQNGVPRDDHSAVPGETYPNDIDDAGGWVDTGDIDSNGDLNGYRIFKKNVVPGVYTLYHPTRIEWNYIYFVRLESAGSTTTGCVGSTTTGQYISETTAAQAPTVCDTSSWVGKDSNRAQGCDGTSSCRVLADGYDTCTDYCAAQQGGLDCVGSWKEESENGDSCVAKDSNRDCPFNWDSSDDICQCSVPTVAPICTETPCTNAGANTYHRNLSDVFDLQKHDFGEQNCQDLKRYNSVVGQEIGLFALAAARQAIHDFHERQKSMVS